MGWLEKKKAYRPRAAASATSRAATVSAVSTPSTSAPRISTPIPSSGSQAAREGDADERRPAEIVQDRPLGRERGAHARARRQRDGFVAIHEAEHVADPRHRRRDGVQDRAADPVLVGREPAERRDLGCREGRLSARRPRERQPAGLATARRPEQHGP